MGFLAVSKKAEKIRVVIFIFPYNPPHPPTPTNPPPGALGSNAPLGRLFRDSSGLRAFGLCRWSERSQRQWQNILRDSRKHSQPHTLPAPFERQKFIAKLHANLNFQACIFRCKIPWPAFSRRPPALTSINRRNRPSTPKLRLLTFVNRPIFCGFPSVSAEILTAPLQIGTRNMGFSEQFPTKKGPGNLTPKYLIPWAPETH